ncbi:MAG: hypothetical protein QOD77_177 [Thermoplasmata archaeon]|jgi:PKD repeat protein|nr:hypothetical protein [Thermoplasmata archaeon]
MAVPATRWLLLGAGAVLLLAALPSTDAQTVPYTTITSAGPLSQISIGTDLACQVTRVGDALFEFFPAGTEPGDCGTFLMEDGVLSTPDFARHAGAIPPTATTGAFTGALPFIAVSQSAVSGAGTSASPYKLTTIVTAGDATVSQADEYVVGNDYYTTLVTVTNDGTAAHSYRLWRAGDCQLQDSDYGYGYADPPGDYAAVGCTENPDNVPPGRIEMWVPKTPGSRYYETSFGTVWNQIGSGLMFPNSCACGSFVDNGAGLSWDFVLPPGVSATFTHDTLFSPLGTIPPPPPPPNPLPVPRFTVEARTACEDSTVHFTDASTDDGSVVSWLWDFDDGSPASTVRHPVHQYTAAGTYDVKLTVTDDKGATASLTKAVFSVGDPNCCPNLQNLSTVEVPEGTLVRFDLVVTDHEHDPITFAYVSDLPTTADALLDAGTFTWRTAAGDSGVYTITFSASDGGCTDEATVEVKVVPAPVPMQVKDFDLDGVADDADNCPSDSNGDQADADHDAVGDVCDPDPVTPGDDAATRTARAGSGLDRDRDGVADGADNCPGTANRGQEDLDADRLGDLCDPDRDGDGVPEASALDVFTDNCPGVGNPDQADVDQDGTGDACVAIAASGRARQGLSNDEASLARQRGSAAGPIVLGLSVGAAVAAVVAAVAVGMARRRSS